jgi:hypothetical protein
MLRLQRCSEVLRIVFRSGAVSAAFLTAGLIASPPAAAQGASSILTKPDPLKIIVSLDKQYMYVYRGTEQVFTSRVSTGKRGYSTPAGIYSILEKRRWHRSNIYNNAPMPFMQRLTWSGIALHASGHVPRYPASHGCIRLPRSSASTLFKKTDVGGHVIVTRGDTTPRPIAHAKLLQPQPLELVTMDAQKALKQRLAYEEGNLVSIALPEPADLNRKYAALSEPAEVMTDATVAPEPMSAKEGALLMADLEHDLHRLERYVTRSEEPVRVLITKRLGRERIRDVQLLLRELGYDPGPIDGFMGRKTGAAIQEYQEDNGLKATGAFSEELRDKLFLDARGEPAPTGHLYVRQGFKRVFDAPVTLKNPDEPLGTHVYLARSFGPTEAQTEWLALTTEEAPGVDAVTALDRVSLSEVLRDRVERMLTPGSSMIVSDEGLGPETGRGTDFVVLN